MKIRGDLKRNMFLSSIYGLIYWHIHSQQVLDMLQLKKCHSKFWLALTCCYPWEHLQVSMIFFSESDGD